VCARVGPKNLGDAGIPHLGMVAWMMP